MKNHVYLYLVLGILFSAFGIISMMVFLTDGKSKYFVKKKLAIGAMIIGMTCMANGCRPVVTCYEVAVQPALNCTDSVNSGGTIILKSTDSVINFDCQYMYYGNVTFRIYQDTDVVCEDSCSTIEGDQFTHLIVNIPQPLKKANYSLRFYYLSLDELTETSAPFEQFNLSVTE